MRDELIEYIRSLADRDYQESAWAKKVPIRDGVYDCMDYAIHFIYDDTCLAENPSKALGWFIKNEEELDAIKRLVSSLDFIFEKYGTKLKDESYIKLKEWNAVIENAKVLKDIFAK
jgi:hypothetical protein